jgi:hypothetical protein
VLSVETSLPLVTPSSHTQGAWTLWAHRYELTNDFCYSDEPALQGDLVIEVLQDGVKIGKALIVSDSDWLPLATIQQMLPPRPERAAAAPRPRHVDAPGDPRPPWLDNPWLLDHWADARINDFPGIPDDGKGTPSDVDENSDESNSDEERLWGDDEIRALYEKRHELDLVGGHDTPDFEWSLRGGKWTFERKGVLYDCVACMTKTRDVDTWCTNWRLNKGASYAIAKYGEDVCVLLGTTWTSKMQFLFDLHQEHGGLEDFVFTQHHLDAWPEPMELALLIVPGAVGDIGRLRKRIQQLRNIWPRRLVT